MLCCVGCMGGRYVIYDVCTPPTTTTTSTTNDQQQGIHLSCCCFSLLATTRDSWLPPTVVYVNKLEPPYHLLWPPSVVSALYKSTIKPSWWQDSFCDGHHCWVLWPRLVTTVSSCGTGNKLSPPDNKMIARLSPAVHRAWKIAFTIFGHSRSRIAC